MDSFLLSIINNLPQIARINGGTALIMDRTGSLIKAVDSNGKPLSSKDFSWLSSTLQSEKTTEISVLSSPDGRKLWVMPIGDIYLCCMENFPAERSEALKKIFLDALPYIAKVTGGEAVLFDKTGKRIASRDSDGNEVKERLIHSPLAQKAIETMSPVFGPSVMDDKHVAVRIPIAPELGIGFSNFFAVKYKKVPSSKDKNSQQMTIDSIPGSSPSFMQCKKLAKKIALSDSTTVIYGETGTGKELMCHAIHNESSRAQGPFIAVNCGGIPETLIETLFFGYEGGAFTGAKKEGHKGVFEQAEGGTLLLDEIGEMSLTLQAHFLRVLQEYEIVRVGGKKRIAVNVRIVAATNRNLRQMVQQGLFRKDLFFRLNVLELNIPPLRDRVSDIPELCSHFIEHFAETLRTTCTGISDKAVECLQRYNWSGNIRELRNVIERAVSLSESNIIGINDLPDYISEYSEKSNELKKLSMLKDTSNQTEKEAIISTLKEFGGNKRLAADKLGISTTTLWRRMKNLEIKEPE